MKIEDARLDEDGFELIPGLLSGERLQTLREELEDESNGSPNRRGLFERFPKTAELSADRLFKDALKELVGRECFVVRGILFDKTTDANWHVRWHQDRAVAVKEKHEVEGFTGWSTKEEVPHALAPAEVLETMVSIRLHLDDSPAENGALRVLAGSHRYGLLADEARTKVKDDCPEVVCEADAGDALVMRPLLLHSSTTATQPQHRRVIHLECATEELPGGLKWHWRL